MNNQSKLTRVLLLLLILICLSFALPSKLAFPFNYPTPSIRPDPKEEKVLTEDLTSQDTEFLIS